MGEIKVGSRVWFRRYETVAFGVVVAADEAYAVVRAAREASCPFNTLEREDLYLDREGAVLALVEEIRKRAASALKDQATAAAEFEKNNTAAHALLREVQAVFRKGRAKAPDA